MIKRRVLLIGLALLSNQLFSQKTFTYNGNTINLDEIPLGRALDIPIKGAKNFVQDKSLSSEKVFASENKNYILVTESYNIINTKSNISSEGSIKLYTVEGKLLWERKKDNYRIYDCLVDSNGKYIHANWSFAGEETNRKLITYDKDGNEVNIIEDVQYYYTGESKDKLYYTKMFNSKSEDQFKLYYKDYSTGEHWEKLFPSIQYSLAVLSVSGDGKYIAVASDNIYYLDNKGNLLWQKKCNESPGFFNISSDGSYSLWVVQRGLIYLLNSKGDLLWEKKKTTFDGYNFRVDNACFVQNDDSVILFSDIVAPNTTMFILLNIQGEIIDKIIINKGYSYRIHAKKINKSYLIYHNGNQIYEYKLKM